MLVPPDTAAGFEIDDTIGLAVLGVPTRLVDVASAGLGTLRPDLELLLRVVHHDPLIEQMIQTCWREMQAEHRRDEPDRSTRSCSGWSRASSR